MKLKDLFDGVKKMLAKKRLAILVVYSSNRKLDKCVSFLAEKMKEHCQKLMIVINGSVEEKGICELKQITNSVRVRENSGYDCGAYKQALIEYIGWDELKEYDDIILLNDSCFGPIYPMEDVLKKMDNSQYDFWGITEQPVIKAGNYTEVKLPHHIQTYFLCISKRMFDTKEFRDFWERLEPCNGYMDTVYNFELKFTEYFNKLGYTSGAYVDSGNMCSSENETQAYVFFDSYRLIAEEHCPFLKKKVFSFPQKDILASNHGEVAKRTIDYIEKNTDYNIELIYDCLITRYNPIDLWIKLHLTFFYRESNWISSSYKSETVYVFWDRYDKQKQISYSDNVVIINKENERSIYKLKDICENYKYIKFIHTANIEKTYIHYSEIEESIGEIFEKNPYIGMLVDSIDLKEEVSQLAGYKYHNKESQRIVDKLGENIEIDCEMINYSYSKNVWFRKTAIIELLNSNIFCNILIECYLNSSEDYKYLPLIYPYIIQRKGFLGGQLVSDIFFDYNMNYYQRALTGMIKEELLYRGIKEFRNVHRINCNLIEFCRKKSGVYIYGAGDIANECFAYLEMNGINVLGFIVTDGKRTDVCCSGLPILELSQVSITQTIGIVIGVNKINRKPVLELLAKRNIKNTVLYED